MAVQEERGNGSIRHSRSERRRLSRRALATCVCGATSPISVELMVGLVLFLRFSVG